MHESESFIYSQDDILGHGATSNVYKGISKKDGSFCALKVFKNKRDSTWKILKRELDILTKIKHENIVRIFGMEIDGCTGQPIIIMEFLNRGTLYDQLREPENLYGFCDQMFLSLLKDLAAGLTQLQIAGIVHRDIKPTNILRSIVSEGREIYKLSDFGTAKAISGEDEMESIVGTEEYVHPAMFEKAFLNREAELISSIHLDQWSLGITLYHVATGKVPFQTKEGLRRNRMCRLQMIKQKPSGVICAREHEDGGIIWERELPATCILSRFLSKEIGNTISHLLETNLAKAWTIPDFLRNVETLLKKVPVHVMQPSQDRLEIFYLNPQDTIPHLKDAIAQEWEIPGQQQLLFHGCINLTLPFETKSISEYPTTRLGQPIILIEKNLIKDIKIPTLLIETISFPKEISAKDSSIAVQICAQIYKMMRHFHHHSHIHDCMMYTVGIINSLISSEIRNTQLLMGHFNYHSLKQEYKSSFESVNILENFTGYSTIRKKYKNVKILFKEAEKLSKIIKSRNIITANVYYNVAERNYLEAIFKKVKANFDEHEKLFAKVREDFQNWQRKSLNALEVISNLKKRLIAETTFQKIYENTKWDKKIRQQTNELIACSKTEANRLSDLNSALDQLVSFDMCFK